MTEQASGTGTRGVAADAGAGGPLEPGLGGAAEPGGGWARTWTRRLLWFELAAVLAVGLGRSAVDSLISLIGSLTAVRSVTKLSTQAVSLNASAAPGRPWLDLSWQVYGIAFGLAPALLVAYLLTREGVGLKGIGVDFTRPWRDLAYGAVVAAAIGGSGLALYLAAHAAGVAVTVVPTTLPAVWWRIPVLVGSAWQNAAVEEITWNGYLLRRFDQLGWRPLRSDVTSALIRGCYHLYQGFGGFVGNFVMGVIFARLYRRWGRVMPLLVAHGLIDTTAFVGYVLLAGHVSWLPT
jgi:membrane protease YdiL (CAAX protease family)